MSAADPIQSQLQASIRAITGTANSYEGDWHALFDKSAIAAGPFNGRLLAWLNAQLGRTYASLPEAQQAYAVLNGAFSWATLTSVFTPAALGTSLLGWFDAERPDKLTLNGSTVQTWTDIAGGLAPTQATASLQPAYSATGFNNRPSVTPDGVDDFLNVESCPFPGVCEVWALVDQKALAADTTVRVIISFGGTLSASRTSVQRSVAAGVNQLQAVIGNGSAGVAVTHTADFSGKSVVRLISDGANAKLELNGVGMSNVAVTPSIGNTRTRLFAANSTSAANFWGSPVNTIAITGLLTAAQATSMYAYLNARKA